MGGRIPKEIVGIMSLLLGLAAAIGSYFSAAQPNMVQTVLFWLALPFLALLVLVILDLLWKWNAVRRISKLNFEQQAAEFCAELRGATSPTVAAFAKSSLGSVKILFCGNRVPTLMEVPAPREARSVFPRVVAKLEPTTTANAKRFLSERARALATAWDEQRDQAQIRANVAHALVFDDELASDYTQGLNEIRFVESDYIQLRCILELAATLNAEDLAKIQIPMVLGAGGLLVYPQKGEIIFHDRSANVDTQPGKIHVFGGNFEPDIKIAGLGHDVDLKSNAVREIAEETRAIVNVDDCLVVLFRENADPAEVKPGAEWKRFARFLPAQFLGVVLTERERARILGSTEGKTEVYKNSELVAKLRNTKNWVPMGWLTVMLWLYLGAPCQAGERFMSPRKARRMFKEVLSN
jgi:hypothetical protein